MSFGNRQPPGIHIPRRELGEPNLTEHPRRLAKEPAQLRKRHLLRLMHPEVLVDELGKRDRRRSTTGPEPLNHLPKRRLRFGPGREPVPLLVILLCQATDASPDRHSADFRHDAPGRLAVHFRINLRHA